MNKTHLTAAALLAACGIANAQFAAHAQLREGDALDGGTVTFLNNSDVNGLGGYAFTLTVDDAGNSLSKIWGSFAGGPGATILTEDTYNDQLEQTSFESFFGMGNSSVAYSPSVNDLFSGATGLDSVWKDTTPVLTEEDPVGSRFSSFNSRPGITDAGTPYWVGGLTDVQGGSTADRAIFFDGNILIQGGDLIAGLGTVSAGSGIDFDFRFSASGTNWISPIDFDTGSATNDIAIVVNGASLTVAGGTVREDDPVPAAVGGTGGENWDNFDFFGINEAGDIFFTGDTNGDTASDEFVFLNDSIVLREGAAVPNGSISGSIEGGFMNEDGDWAVVWDIDTDSGNLEALFYNGDLILVEGDLVDWNNDGSINVLDSGAFLTDFTGISSLTVSDRLADGSVNIAFTADCNVGGTVLEGGFLLIVPGTGGCPADLTGSSDPNDPTFGQPDGDADGDDFFFYLDAFTAGNFAVCDLTGSSDPNDSSFGNPDGDCDGDDFFFYLDLFVQGCP